MNSDDFSTQVDLTASPHTVSLDVEMNFLNPFQRVVDSQKTISPQLKTSQSVNIVGVDTLKIGFNIALSKAQLTGWVVTKKSVIQEYEDDLISEVYSRRWRTKNGIEIYFRYIPVGYQGEVINLLLIEFNSVPKLLGFCSHSQIQDWEKVWDSINKILDDIHFLVKLPDIRDGIIYRIDLCANFQVGKNVSNFLSIISQRYFPHRILHSYPGKQVIFSAQDISVSFYNKYSLCKKDKQCNYEDAAGILRMEIQIRSKRQVQKWLRSNEPTLRMITKGKVIVRLAQDLRTLKLDKPIAENLVERISTSNDLSKTEIKNLISYVILRDTKSREELRTLCTVKSISDREKMLLKAGLSGQTTSNLRETLPSLLDLLQAGNNVEKVLAIQEQDEVPNSEVNVTDTIPQNERWQFMPDELGPLKDWWLSNSYKSNDRSELLQRSQGDAAQQLLQFVPYLSAPPIPAQKLTQEGIHVTQ